jgi:glycosyltransferase involved in cell wall biosynthesis
MAAPLAVSVVIPVFNEAETLVELCREVQTHAADFADKLEIIFVDDGSTDRTGEILAELADREAQVGVVSLAINSGKAAALEAGFRHVKGDVVITLDGDLQDDPREIPRFIATLREGFDLVSGWKVDRRDPWHKTVPSRIFNFVVARVFALPLHDFNCGFKAYRREVVDRLELYGEMHRFIPVLAHAMGARVTEIPVEHHPRRSGRSKYGLGRLVKGFLDFVTVFVTTRYLKRPLHFFGALGIGLGGIGSVLLIYLAALWLLGERPIGNRPLLFYGILLAILGVQLFSLGIVSELLVRLGHRREEPLVTTTRGLAGTSGRRGTRWAE